MTTQLSPLPIQRFQDNNNNPLAGGQLYTYQAGTSTPQATYTDSTGGTPNTNPVIMNARGEANVWLTTGQGYKLVLKDASANTIWTQDQVFSGVTSDFVTNLASSTGSSGSSSVGYLMSVAGTAVGRTVQNKLDDVVNAADFGLKTTNTGAQNVTALQNAVNFAIAVGGCTIHIDRGTYDFNNSINFTSANNTRVTGEGPDATILRITSATADFFTSTGTTYYQTFDNLSLTSTVTRTSGYMMNFGVSSGLWKRGLIYRVRIQQHFGGIILQGFEQSTIAETYIVNPSGAGTALACGTPAATNQGANLLVVDCFLRGFNDITQAQPAIGSYGVYVYDVQALFFVNTDIGNFLTSAMVVSPQTNCANCYFSQTFFDGTNNSDNVVFAGTGTIQQFQFTGCWFNGAGAAGTGHIDCFGVNATSGPTYYDINFTGCRFISTSGSGFYSTTRYNDFTFVGCVFTNCGLNASSTQRNAIQLSSVGGASFKSPVITGCKFQGSGAHDVRVELNANGVTLTGNAFGSDVSIAATQMLGNAAGNYNPTVAGIGTSVASAAVMVIPSTNNYVLVSGTTNITRIEPTFPGHEVSFRFQGALTVTKDASNLRMPSNFVTNGNSIWNAVCEANGDWREVARMSY